MMMLNAAIGLFKKRVDEAGVISRGVFFSHLPRKPFVVIFVRAVLVVCQYRCLSIPRNLVLCAEKGFGIRKGKL